MTLTENNYYSIRANKRYLSVSQYKSFQKCEAAALAEINGVWKRPDTTALLVGGYIDAWFEGSLSRFYEKNPSIFKKDGKLKADFTQAVELIYRIKQDDLFMEYMSGEKQRIFTASLFGAEWKIKIDSLLPDKIVDLKIMRSMERIMGKSFVEYWGYDLQMAIYAAVYKAVTGKDLDTYLAVATKQTPADIEIIEIPKWRRDELLAEVERSVPRILSIKAGEIQPERCGVCDYCRSTKKLTEPIDFELVGLSNAERKAIFGEL